MGQASIRMSAASDRAACQRARRARAVAGYRRWLTLLASRAAERREIRSWLRTNPPSVGRDSGARC